MNTVSNSIEHEIAALPRNLRAEVLDFVHFIKQRHGLGAAPTNSADTSDQGDSPLYQALSDAGMVGCIDTNDQFSTRYKNELDFSTKLGIQS